MITRYSLYCLAFVLFASGLRAQDVGEKVYLARCARCHGPTGEGTKKHPQKLLGSLSLAQLTRQIEKTMPEDDPGSCQGEEAAKVAEFIYQAFYSPLAQARTAPARIDLSRLSVHQYQNIASDLIASFRPVSRWNDQRGLEGDYNSAGKDRKNKTGLQRRDPEVRFDFGEESPVPDKVDAKEFSLRWNGSLFAPESGEYEIIVRSDNAVRIWVNDQKKPIIDAWVKSGSDTEFRASIRLLSGRAYPLKLEMRKGAKEKKGSIELAWRVPRQAPATIPERCLLPQRLPETFVLTTPFPPDDRSVGYERSNTTSKAWVQATRDASLEVAAYISDHLGELAGIKENASDRELKLRQFAQQFTERALRRPLSDEQKKFYLDRAFEGRDLDTAIKHVILRVLNSPFFLFPETNQELDSYDTATRLSLNLWDSFPDKELLDAATANRLKTPAEVANQAERMLNDPRAKAKLREFYMQWLKVDPAPDLSKNRKSFPDFEPILVNDLRTSLELFLEQSALSESGNYRELFLTEDLYLNDRLARYLGLKLPENSGFQKVAAEKGKRAGVLTHPYMMASFAYSEDSSPIHRGVFLARSVMGVALRTPPIAVAPVAGDLHPNLTTRERVLMQTKADACQSCHAVINPLGFTLENFDAVGKFRVQEKGKPIDPTGTYQARSGEVIRFAGPRELAEYVVKSTDTQEAFIEQLFHHLIHQPIRAYGPQQLTELRESFEKQDYRLRRLTIDIATAAALKPRTIAQAKQK